MFWTSCTNDGELAYWEMIVFSTSIT